eukprot:GEZU01030429.1.p1 GENE.GEZU01030429.1~~GEZU01030429.1.p1  ORF type:complete len:449 (+),score=130.50 GEZU01030429.1:59-1405(+)
MELLRRSKNNNSSIMFLSTWLKVHMNNMARGLDDQGANHTLEKAFLQLNLNLFEDALVTLKQFMDKSKSKAQIFNYPFFPGFMGVVSFMCYCIRKAKRAEDDEANGFLAEAKRFLHISLEKDPSNQSFVYIYGQVLLEEGKTQECGDIYKKFLILYDQNPNAYKIYLEYLLSTNVVVANEEDDEDRDMLEQQPLETDKDLIAEVCSCCDKYLNCDPVALQPLQMLHYYFNRDLLPPTVFIASKFARALEYMGDSEELWQCFAIILHKLVREANDDDDGITVVMDHLRDVVQLTKWWDEFHFDTASIPGGADDDNNSGAAAKAAATNLDSRTIEILICKSICAHYLRCCSNIVAAAAADGETTTTTISTASASATTTTTIAWDPYTARVIEFLARRKLLTAPSKQVYSKFDLASIYIQQQRSAAAATTTRKSSSSSSGGSADHAIPIDD